MWLFLGSYPLGFALFHSVFMLLYPPGPIRILPLRKKVTGVAGFIKAFPLRGRSPRSVG